MLKLTYTRKSDAQQSVTVFGDPEGIRDLYWQLTHNYQAQDGTAIGEIIVTNLDGIKISRKELTTEPHTWSTNLSRLGK